MFKCILSTLLLIGLASCGVHRESAPQISAPSSLHQIQDFPKVQELFLKLEEASNHAGAPYSLTYDQNFWFANTSRCEKVNGAKASQIFVSYLTRTIRELRVKRDPSTLQSVRQLGDVIRSGAQFTVCEDSRTNGELKTNNIYLMADDNSLRLMVTKTN
jgi:hypothetical protein